MAYFAWRFGKFGPCEPGKPHIVSAGSLRLHIIRDF